MTVSLLKDVAAGRAPDLLTLTVDQYHRMIAEGILHEGGPVELIDGLLVRKDRSDRGGAAMSHGPRHALGVTRLQRALKPAQSASFHLKYQLPVTLAATQEPEPDGAVVRGLPEDYTTRHPGPGDLVAVVEVADTSLDYDRSTKRRLYATAGIPTYWIVNLVDGWLEVYERPDPAQGTYASRTDVLPGQTTTLTLGGVVLTVAAADILPP